MEYKEDWPQAQERIEAWWEGRLLDRPCLQVTAPRSGQEEALKSATIRPPEITLERWWTDVDYVMERQTQRIASTFWGGEAFPLFNPNLGPDTFAAFFGAPMRFLDESTNWVEPIIDDWDHAPALCISENSPWWRKQLQLVRAGQEAGRGRWLTGIPDTHSGADALSALRGRARLCLDLYDNPAVVRQAMDKMVEAVRYAYDVYFGIVEPNRYGSTSGWLPAWHLGRANVIQCDFIALISPAMMRDFVLPSILAEACSLERAIFHLDGPDAICHLETLLAVPEIQAIQWVPGAGALPMTRWIPLLQRIQAAHKSIHVSATPEEVPTLLDALNPAGLMIHTSARSENEARDLLALVASAATTSRTPNSRC